MISDKYCKQSSHYGRSVKHNEQKGNLQSITKGKYISVKYQYLFNFMKKSL